MKKLLLILLCLPMIGFGQNWEKTIQNGEPGINSLQQTSDGGYIFSGSLNNEGYVLKMDVFGNEEWSILTPSFWTKQGIVQTVDGGYVYLSYANGGTYAVYKINSSGTTEWSQQSLFTNKIPQSIKPTNDGGYIISGQDNWTSPVVNGSFLIKLDALGNQQWIKYYQNNSCNDWDGVDGSDVQQTSDGGYVLGCYCDNFSLDEKKAKIVKTDALGNEQWNNTYNTGSNHLLYNKIEQTADGGYALCGWIRDNSSNANLNFIKVNSSGALEWNNTYGDFFNSGLIYSVGTSFQQTNDGGYIITGQDLSDYAIGGSEGTLLLLKLNSNGSEQWYKFYGGLDTISVGASVRQTSDNGYIISGRSNNSDETFVCINIIKTDFQGNITSSFNIPVNTNRKLEKTVDILGKETKLQTNTPLIEIYDDGTVEKRIVVD